MNTKLDYAINKRNNYIKYLTEYSNKIYDNLIKQDLSMKDFKQKYNSELEKIIVHEDNSHNTKHH